MEIQDKKPDIILELERKLNQEFEKVELKNINDTPNELNPKTDIRRYSVDKAGNIIGINISGYRSIIAMVGDFIIRLSENNRFIDSFNELEGIVIIDEFDNHLHPKWQKMLVQKLTDIFPKNPIYSFNT